MGQRIKLYVNGVLSARETNIARVFRFVMRFPDVLLAPWVLEVEILLTYFAARLASLGIPLGLSALGAQAAPQLADLAGSHQRAGFQAAAARVNLGYMMVCGALALLILAIAPYLAIRFAALDPEFEALLIWFLVGQSAPVLFGATALLMHSVERGVFYDLLSCVTAVMFLCTVMFSGMFDGVLIAQTLAVAQLTHAGICAALLTQAGIWPGLTAVFHKEIKLF